MITSKDLSVLTPFMDFEVDDDSPLPAAAPACPAGKDDDLPIYMAALPNGKRTPILKTMLTSACERNCYYCAFRRGRDFQRSTFLPDEMARLVLQAWKKGTVKGVFLSSGVAGGGVRTQDRLLAAAEILRRKLDFRGYLHLKLMPGSERAQVEQAMLLADRVSVNLEAPTTERLAILAPEKQYLHELLTPLRWVEEIRKSQPGWQGWKGRWASSVTQFVAGGSGESDLELLAATAFLHRELRLSRVYFSGFKPVLDTPLENQPAIDPWRQNRLYQASFLLRDYGFDLEDLPFSPQGGLPLEMDPKQAWAQDHLLHTPLEINRADYTQLLRVPGIGKRGAERIISARLKGPLRSMEDLMAAGVRAPRAAPYILLNGRQPAAQLRLF